jgi:hypothetical protein
VDATMQGVKKFRKLVGIQAITRFAHDT